MSEKFRLNILRGMASVMNIWPADSPGDFLEDYQSDTELLRGDWEVVGKDLRGAMEYLIHESEENKVTSAI